MFVSSIRSLIHYRLLSQCIQYVDALAHQTPPDIGREYLWCAYHGTQLAVFISVGLVCISMRTGERETDSGNTRVAQHDIAAERKKKKK